MKHILTYWILFFLLFINKGEITAQTIKNKSVNHTTANVATSTYKCLNKELSINVHIVRDSLRLPNVTEPAVLNAIAEVNRIFKPICLSFKVCKFNYIDNWKYNKFSVPDEVEEVKVLYNVRKTINMYFVLTLAGTSEPGYAANPTDVASAADNKDSNNVVIIGTNVVNGNFISHELGHLFGLYDTYENIKNGAEFVNESNCTAAGDLVCDTEADISTTPTDFIGCKYVGSYKDAKNDYYTPPIDNIMSNHPAGCISKFTTGQYDRISSTFLAFRKYLY